MKIVQRLALTMLAPFACMAPAMAQAQTPPHSLGVGGRTQPAAVPDDSLERWFGSKEDITGAATPTSDPVFPGLQPVDSASQQQVASLQIQMAHLNSNLADMAKLLAALEPFVDKELEALLNAASSQVRDAGRAALADLNSQPQVNDRLHSKLKWIRSLTTPPARHDP